VNGPTARSLFLIDATLRSRIADVCLAPAGRRTDPPASVDSPAPGGSKNRLRDEAVAASQR